MLPPNWQLLTQKQKDFIADKFMDAVNYSIAGAVFNEILSSRRVVLMLLGLLVYFGIMGALTGIQRKDDADH